MLKLEHLFWLKEGMYIVAAFDWQKVILGKILSMLLLLRKIEVFTMKL